MAPYFLHIYLWHVVNYDKSLKGDFAANVPSSTGNIYPHQWKDEEVAKSVIFQLYNYWIWFFPHLYPVGFENIMNILWISVKGGNIFLSYITSVTICYKTVYLFSYLNERKTIYGQFIDWIVTLMHFTCKQLNILLTAVYLAVHFTLQFVANSYVK